jgi:hypothetical protein
MRIFVMPFRPATQGEGLSALPPEADIKPWHQEVRFVPEAEQLGLQQGFTTGETGLGVILHGSNLEPLMSALCQKRAHAPQQK